jgi:hypothetical protein
MALSPRTWVSGELVTAAQGNAEWRDMITSLNTGAVALTGQAQYDIIGYATSASQIARIAGVANAVFVTDGSKVPSLATTLPAVNGAALTGMAPFAGYAVTKADAVNTVAETDVITFTVPANKWADGDIVVLEGWFLHKNNRGGTTAFNQKIYVGGVSVSPPNATWAFPDLAVEQTVPFGMRFQRVGSAVWMRKNMSGTAVVQEVLDGDFADGSWGGWAAGTFVMTWTPTFTADIIVKVSVTMANAHASTYLKPQACRAWKIGAP